MAIRTKSMSKEHWLLEVLANPITKLPQELSKFQLTENGIIDARINLTNTAGHTTWETGQNEYERMATEARNATTVDVALSGLREVEPVYSHFKLSGRILDVGGGAGKVREFLPIDSQFVCTDPWPYALENPCAAELSAYKCLDDPCNFICANAEFQPFVAESFDWVHMRSMLDHVQIPDLAIREAWRVLRKDGHILVGLFVEGGRSGVTHLSAKVKHWVKDVLAIAGFRRWVDHHTWHPTYRNLLKLISDNGFVVKETYWQPAYIDKVCYVLAQKRS